MPIIINASTNAPSVKMLFEKYAQDFPKDMATAMTRTAFGAMKALQNDASMYLDRPAPKTVKAFYYKKATAQNLQAEVGTREYDYQPWQKRHHLAAAIFGGEGSVKGSERRLRKMGLIGSNERVAPGPAMEVDQYGNARGGKVVQLLSQIRALELESGVTANRRSGAKSMAFFGTINGSKGIWEREGKRGIRLMLQAIPMPVYKPQFPVVHIVEQYFADNLEREFWKAWQQGQEIRRSRGL